jgi:hypothetical protein
MFEQTLIRDFSLIIVMRIENLLKSGSSININGNSNFGFSGSKNAKGFFEGPFFLRKRPDYIDLDISDGVDFVLQIARKGNVVNFFINSKLITNVKYSERKFNFSIRELRGKIKVSRFLINGKNIVKDKKIKPVIKLDHYSPQKRRVTFSHSLTDDYQNDFDFIYSDMDVDEEFLNLFFYVVEEDNYEK